ncbi:hypothetical protein HHK36_025281 [Tetracentron sinense]|uniref:Uncharacterized protein n=1 Tax=Tetracentron sinense TaxID=13715 RepID=A0A835D8B5_TETSI|nr:hypothetical protein HHK36_025281 [Tetracentron sinense]
MALQAPPGPPPTSVKTTVAPLIHWLPPEMSAYEARPIALPSDHPSFLHLFISSFLLNNLCLQLHPRPIFVATADILSVLNLSFFVYVSVHEFSYNSLHAGIFTVTEHPLKSYLITTSVLKILRFRAYEPVATKNVNDTDVRKTRKAQIKRDEAIGRALPIAIVVGIAAMAGLYFYLNNTF